MSENFPNVYYEQLSKLIVSNPTISLMEGEVCFYEGNVKTYKSFTKTKEKPHKKTSLILNPLFVGVRRQTSVETIEETKKEYYSGKLYFTNCRLVFDCSVDGFNLEIPQIVSISQYKDGVQVKSKAMHYNIVTSDSQKIMDIINLMNKAQGI